MLCMYIYIFVYASFVKRYAISVLYELLSVVFKRSYSFPLSAVKFV